MDMHDIEGLADQDKRMFVTITHDYSLRGKWLVIEDDRGNQFILDKMIVEEDGGVSFRAFEFTKKRTKKGSYAGYLPQVRDIAGYTPPNGERIPSRRELIKYHVIGWEDRKIA